MRALVSRDIPPELRSRLDSEDLLQSAFLQACQRIQSFEYRGAQSLEQWLSAILLNKLRDKIRFHSALCRSVHRETAGTEIAEIAVDQSECDPVRLSEIARRQADVLAALDKLPADEQEILCLRFFDHCTWSEIAQRMNSNADRVRRRGFDAMERVLRSFF